MGRASGAGRRSTPRLQYDAEGRITQLTLDSAIRWAAAVVWPQRLRVALGYPDAVTVLAGGRRRGRPTGVAGGGWPRAAALRPAERRGPRLRSRSPRPAEPRLSAGSHRGRPRRADARGRVGDVVGQHARGAIAPEAFLDAAVRALPRETDEQNAERVLGYRRRGRSGGSCRTSSGSLRSAALEAMLTSGLERASTTSQKAAWFNALRDTRTDAADARRGSHACGVARRRVPGLPLAEPDEITLALELAVREVPAGGRSCSSSTIGRRIPIARRDSRS